MTSNTTPSGVASASSIYSNAYPVWQAFNSTLARGQCPKNAEFTSGIYVQYQFEKEIKVNAVSACYILNNNTATFKLCGSNDGETWVDLCTNVAAGNNAFKYYSVDNNVAYMYYRFVMTSHSHNMPNNGDGYKFQLYG